MPAAAPLWVCAEYLCVVMWSDVVVSLTAPLEKNLWTYLREHPEYEATYFTYPFTDDA